MAAPLYKLKQTIQDHKDSVTVVAFSQNGCKYLATGSADKTVHIYASDSLSKIATLSFTSNPRGGINSLSWSPKDVRDGKLILVGTDDGCLSIYDIEAGGNAPLVMRSGEQAHRASAACLSTAWGAGYMASASLHGEVILYSVDPSNPQLGLQIKWRKEAAHSDPVTGLGFASATDARDKSKKRVLVSAGLDGFVHFWDLDSGAAFRPPVFFPTTKAGQEGLPTPISSLQVAPSGKHILVGTMDGNIRLWEVDSNRVVRTLPNASNTQRLTSPTIATPNRKFQYIVMGAEDGMVVYWPVTLPKEMAGGAEDQLGPRPVLPESGAHAQNHAAPVLTCHANSNSALLVSGSTVNQACVKVWEYVGPS